MLLRNPLQRPGYLSKLIWQCLVVYGLGMGSVFASSYPTLNDADKAWIGQQIFNNECAARIACLSSWNAAEPFPSLGIGHFIWYRKDQHDIFEESFPALIRYLESQGIEIPAWIIAAEYDAPWESRQAFLDQQQAPDLTQLRELLASTMTEQTEFIIQRFEASLNKLLAVSAADESETITRNFFAVANAHPPYGLYALIDYVNFKGEGIVATERYANQGWGLLQVLQGMSEQTPPLEAFVDSARRTLQTRVDNSPAIRNEAQWLPGWNKRLDTYLPTRTLGEN